jgi:V/A-type H+-transporting ATPase subunit D
MAEYLEDRPATTAALQELREERQLIREGYDFLDEKRLLLAAEILRQLERYQRLIEDFTELQQRTGTALRAAVNHQGLDGLQVYPGREMEEASLQQDSRSFLGVTVVENRLTGELPQIPVTPGKPSTEARHCEA